MNTLKIKEKFNVETFKLGIIGINKVTSTSKIKKIIAIRKNCNERLDRIKFILSNPHSKGVTFSRSKEILELKIKETIIIKTLNNTKIIPSLIITFIPLLLTLRAETTSTSLYY